MISKNSKHSNETARSSNRRWRLSHLAFCAAALPLWSACVEPSAESALGSKTQELRNGADRLRNYIARQVGGLRVCRRRSREVAAQLVQVAAHGMPPVPVPEHVAQPVRHECCSAVDVVE